MPRRLCVYKSSHLQMPTKHSPQRNILQALVKVCIDADIMAVESMRLALRLQLDETQDLLGSLNHDDNDTRAAILLWRAELTRELDVWTSRGVAIGFAREHLASRQAIRRLYQRKPLQEMTSVLFDEWLALPLRQML
jgi:hypothetical protein